MVEEELVKEQHTSVKIFIFTLNYFCFNLSFNLHASCLRQNSLPYKTICVVSRLSYQWTGLE